MVDGAEDDQKGRTEPEILQIDGPEGRPNWKGPATLGLPGGDAEVGHDNVPDSEPEVEEEEDELDDVAEARGPVTAHSMPVSSNTQAPPDHNKLLKLFAAADPLTASKVKAILGALVRSGIITDYQLWATSQEKRYGIVDIALARAKDHVNIVHMWPQIRFLRGHMLGDAQKELHMVVAWTLLGLIAGMWVGE